VLAGFVSQKQRSPARLNTHPCAASSDSYETLTTDFIMHQIVVSSSKCRQVQKGAPMIAARQVWGIIHGHVPRKQWVSSEDIYAIVELHGKLDEEDRQPQSSRSRTPKWKTLVHNVLANRVKKGRIRSRKRQNHT